MAFLDNRDMGTRPIEPKQKTAEQIAAEHAHRLKFGSHYAQSAQQFAQGGELGRRITGESLEFRPNADRYDRDGSQYLLNLPKAEQ